MPEATGTRSRSLVYDRGMPVSVNLQTVHPRKLAAVRREVAPGAAGSAWGPALGKVWEFIRRDSLRFAAIHFLIASCASFMRLYGPRWTATAALAFRSRTPRPQFQMC